MGVEGREGVGRVGVRVDESGVGIECREREWEREWGWGRKSKCVVRRGREGAWKGDKVGAQGMAE